ncbi:MAG: HNH endonuclease signature motif containing protein [Clostridium sp.]
MAQDFAKKFYRSKAWIIFRENFLLEKTYDPETFKRVAITCECCNQKIIESKFIQLHHIIELTEQNINDVNITLNPDNIQVLCQTCHNKTHGRFSKGARPKTKTNGVYIIYGPPMSGKTSYVLEHMYKGDLVVDMDRLYQAISMQPMYDKPDNIKYNVLQVRNLLLDNIKTRYGKFNSAWIVGGYANKHDRERLARDLGAELIHIEASKEDCYYRLQYCNDYRQDNQEEWKEYINKWFEEFS